VYVTNAQSAVPSFQLTHLFGDTICFHSFFLMLYAKKSPYTYWLAPGGGAAPQAKSAFRVSDATEQSIYGNK
jgi:hypothetical protein